MENNVLQTPFKTVLRLKESMQQNEALKKEVRDLKEQLQLHRNLLPRQEETEQPPAETQGEQESLRHKLNQTRTQLQPKEEEIQTLLRRSSEREEELKQLREQLLHSLRTELRELRAQQEEASRSTVEAVKKELQVEFEKLREDHHSAHLQTRNDQLMLLHNISLKVTKLLMEERARSEEVLQLRRHLLSLETEAGDERRRLRERLEELEQSVEMVDAQLHVHQEAIAELHVMSRLAEEEQQEAQEEDE